MREALTADRTAPGGMLGLIARASAPFTSVVVGLLWFRNAWLTLVLYHVQMLFWSHRELRRLRLGWYLQPGVAMCAPAALSGLLTYALLPRMVRLPLGEWLAGVGLQGPALVLFVFCYGIVHPLIEQAHWGAIRRDGRLGPGAHLAFAAYHGLVLQAFMRPEWAALCLAVLVGSSVAWHRLDTRPAGGLAIPALSHLFADFGMVLAVWARL